MSKTLQIKVCGVRDQSESIDALGVDYIGHIFWEHSSRYLDRAAAEAASKIPVEAKRIGVFVDASLDELMSQVEKYHLDGVQLHGNESASALAQLRQRFGGLILRPSRLMNISTLAAWQPIQKVSISLYSMQPEGCPAETVTPLTGRC
jgi:Phosphoribosylanthranilate isomerase